jgi:hypothetical protein
MDLLNGVGGVGDLPMISKGIMSSREDERPTKISVSMLSSSKH